MSRKSHSNTKGMRDHLRDCGMRLLPKMSLSLLLPAGPELIDSDVSDALAPAEELCRRSLANIGFVAPRLAAAFDAEAMDPSMEFCDYY
ncbi:MAG: hypothetical protein PHS41_09330 [Victivallaceae bacterium]|nr:hypothetical protein [Victivallaceae bacterium]